MLKLLLQLYNGTISESARNPRDKAKQSLSGLQVVVQSRQQRSSWRSSFQHSNSCLGSDQVTKPQCHLQLHSSQRLRPPASITAQACIQLSNSPEDCTHQRSPQMRGRLQSHPQPGSSRTTCPSPGRSQVHSPHNSNRQKSCIQAHQMSLMSLLQCL